MRILAIFTLAIAAIILGSPGDARAYPQYQLARDVTCTGCHLSPAGGGLLNENGLAVAESIAHDGNDARFLHGVGLPSWLQLSAEARAAAGFVDPGVASADAYPMQLEGEARAGGHGFTVNVLAGFRSPQDGGSIVHALWSRQHYVMWQSNPDGNDGFYIRAGRLSPVFGLRLAEHIAYTQRFGGAPLYDEAYGAVASYVTPAFEVHASGFVHDPYDVTTEHGDGGAVYAEVRIGAHAAIGVDAKYAGESTIAKSYAGVTGKLYLEGPDLQLQGEVVGIREKIRGDATDPTDDKVDQIAAYVLGSRPLGGGFQLDVGAGHFTQDTRVKGLYRDCVDANVHWFQTSHLEWLLTTRVELLDGGSGPNGGYALAQVHYRM